MFREMRRDRQQISNQECRDLLKSEPRGVLAVLGDSDYPYTVPMNFIYDETENKIYFHCAMAGHKVDAIQKHDKVSFCIYDQGYRREGEWALNIRSVIAFGRITIVSDREEANRWLRQLAQKYYPDMTSIEKMMQGHAHRALCLEMTIDHMTGKLVNES